MKRALRLAALLLLALPAQAQDRRAFDATRLARIDAALNERVENGTLPGAVAMVLRDGKVVYERAVGWADREAGRRMTTDAVFRIASQTKAITSTAVMILVEEGKLALTDPVSRFLPGFARTMVAVSADSLEPARRGITIFDLLTHTAGISYGTEPRVAKRYEAAQLGPAAGYGWYTADKDEPICTTMDRLATLPIVAQPGATFVYGYNTDILGCVVERVSGMPLDRFVRERITEPLGMRDTHFYLPSEQQGRLAAVYGSLSGAAYSRVQDGAKGQGHYVTGPRRSFAGGAGMVSTARDYSRFLQMLLNGGQLDGVRILSPSTVEVMTTNQVGTRYSANGMGFGLGFSITERPGADGFTTPGTWGWGGAYGTIYKVDPRERLVMVLMIQMLPNGSDIREKFATLVYQALVDAPR